MESDFQWSVRSRDNWFLAEYKTFLWENKIIKLYFVFFIYIPVSLVLAGFKNSRQ